MSTINAQALFQKLNGREDAGFATIHTPVYTTPRGIPYLQDPGVVVLARPHTNIAGVAGFLAGFDPELNFSAYLDDPTSLPDGAQLSKIAGQLCYMSFGPKRSMNAQAKRYFDNLKSSGHGSVFEHATFSLLLYGISRSLTHELIRHRAGFGYCLTGDTLIYSNKTQGKKLNGAKKRRLDDLYAMTQTPHGRSRLTLLQIRCLDEQTGTFTTGKVKSVVCSGVKPVFTVTLADGKTITATKEHRFLTRDGWKALEEIVGGLSVSASGIANYTKSDAEIMVNGQPIYRNAERRAVSGIREEIYARDNYTCRLCGKHSGRLTIHHILPLWARPDLVSEPDNLSTLCRSCHLRVNHHEEEYVEAFGRRAEELNNAVRPVKKNALLIPKSVKIVSVTYTGEQMTYDIEMKGPNHNFVANGIITHNSQLSQRFVSGRMLRFVERPEYRTDEQLHAQFVQRIERSADEYASLASRLLEMQQAGESILSADVRTDLRKKVQQAARSVLPNETEAPIVVTGNGRSWRHVIEERASAHAEVEIRALAVRIFLCLRQVDPVLFDDYTLELLPDGTHIVKTAFEKV